MKPKDTNNMVAIIIRNGNGEFFVHQRAGNKPMFPNLYGPGCGGHIQAGESRDEAAKRELMEETGINAQPTFLFEFPYKPGHTDYVYELATDASITPEDREWQWWGWQTQKQLEELLAQNKLMPDTTLFLPRYLKSQADKI